LRKVDRMAKLMLADYYWALPFWRAQDQDRLWHRKIRVFKHLFAIYKVDLILNMYYSINQGTLPAPRPWARERRFDMEKQAVFPDNLPSWMKNLFEVMKLPFPPAVKAGSFVFVSGVTCFLDRKTEAPVEAIEAQTKETLEVIKDTLEAAGSSLEKVVKVTVFLRDAEDFSKMNEVYRTFFPKDPPARSTIITGLLLPQMLVEMECMAMV